MTAENRYQDQGRTDWTDHDWELVETGPLQPLHHMALDQVLLDEVAAGRRAPTLRFWEWARPAVVIGTFQSVRNEVDHEAAQQHGIEVVRRISGGGAMFVEPGNSITYSIYAPKSLIAGMTFSEGYAAMDAFVLSALADLGIKAWYEPLNDITSDAGKIAGAAQAHRRSAVLHHVTMAYNIDVDRLMQVLRVGREKMSDKGTKSAAKRVDPLRRQTGLPRDTIVDRMVDTFRRRHGLRNGAVSDREWALAEALIQDKFATDAWRYKVP